MTIGALALPATTAAAAAWRPPVDGPVVARFRAGPDPFAAGQRRGLDLAARAGAPAVAPCAGRVAFAGAVPRRGGAVTIRCGVLVATVLGLASPAVEAGDDLVAGDRIGVVGRGGRVRLGARRAVDRFGYVDPAALLGAGAARGPVVVPARRLGRGPRGPRGAARRPRPAAGPLVAPATGERPAPAAVRVPREAAAGAPVALAAWLGLGLLAVALPSGRLALGRPRRSGSPVHPGRRQLAR
jgi:hypothetical protein